MKKKLLLLTPLFLLTIITVSGQVLINEYSAANYDDVPDNYGEFEDWIELYNAGVASVDLSGYYLSDREDEPTKYSIPAGVTISAGGFVRFWCSSRNLFAGTNYHTNFKLTQTTGAEAVVFADATGTIIDIQQLDNPNQTNHSWGRSPNGGADWRIYTCLLYTSPSPRDRTRSRMPSSA